MVPPFSPASVASSPEEQLSREARGEPVDISVKTDWFREIRVAVAAEWRADTMEGPGKRWAFVMCAQVAMARGPRVYWDWTVPMGLRNIFD